MSGSGNIADLTATMCFCWERPLESAAHLDRRQKKAQEYFEQFTGSFGDSANSESDNISGDKPNDKNLGSTFILVWGDTK